MDFVLKQRQLALFEELCRKFPVRPQTRKAILQAIVDGTLADKPAPRGR